MAKFTSSDFNNAQSQSGVVHENKTHTSHTDASKLEQGYSTTPPVGGLGAYYLMQETSGTTLYDFSGNGRNGSSNNGAGPGGTGTRTAPLNTTAWSFDGTDDWALTGVNPSSLGYTQITLGVWMMPDTVKTQRLIMARDSAGSGIGLRCNSDGSIEMATYPSPKISATTSSSTYTTGNWQSAFGTYSDSNGLRIYYNGSLMSTNSSTGLQPPNYNFAIGTYYSGGSAQATYFNGGIGIAVIAPFEFTQTQVQKWHDVVSTSGTLQTQSKSV